MNPEEYEVMRSVEDRHWWYRGLRAILARRLAKTVSIPPAALLDAGCGTGANLRLFRKLFPQARLTGVDISPAALEKIAALDGVTLALGDVNRMTLADASFDLVFSANVLGQESAVPHMAVAEFFRLLRPGGLLLLNLPALRCLRGEHDEAVHDIRRFDTPQVRSLLIEAGFGEVECNYWNCLLTGPLWLRRQWTRRRGKHGAEAASDLEASGGLLNAPLGLWMECESRLAAAWPLPFGSSLFVSARKPISSKV